MEELPQVRTSSGYSIAAAALTALLGPLAAHLYRAKQ